MNPYLGDIERFVEPQPVPEGWLSLTEREAEEFETLPKALRVERYIKSHREDKCANCGGFVGNHSSKKFLHCASSHLARLQVAKLEEQMNPDFDKELVNGQ